MNLLIREGRINDAPAIAAHNRKLAAETEDMKLDPAVVLEGVKAVFADSSRGFYLVAADGGRIVGQMLITYEWLPLTNSQRWWLTSVYVDPGYRRRGVFRALYDAVVERARLDPRASGLRLYVDSGNRRAQQTYADLGMSQTNERFYEIDFRAH